MTDCALALVGRGRCLLHRGPDAARWVGIFLFVAIGIGLRSPWPADEPRFALAAMDMVLNDHWLLPHRGGEIYADKPPFFLWLQALFYLITGNMRIAFLLPSLFASMATLWMVHDLTRRLFGREQAWFAVLLLLVTLQFTLQAKTAQIDATVCALITLGAYGLTRHYCLGPNVGWYAVAWFAMGVGIITKGVGFLPVFLLPGFWLASKHNERPPAETAKPGWRFRCAPLLILVPAFLWLLPLFVSAYVDNRQEMAAYLDEILFRQTVTRYAGGLGHFKPAWYYLTDVIPGLWMPLSVLLIWLIPDWVRHLRGWSIVHWGLISFVLLGLLFFTMSPGKRGVYLLPLLPPLAVLAGGSVHTLVGRDKPVILLRIIALLIGASLLLAAGATSFELGPLSDRLERAEMELLPTMLFLMLLGSIWVITAILIRSGGAFTVAVTASWLLLCTWGFSLLDPVRSADQLMKKAASRIGPESELAIAGFREQQLLQADRPVVHWGYHSAVDDQLVDAAEWLRADRNRYLLAPEDSSSSCFGDGVGNWIGFRHRRDWRLLSAADIGPEIRCSGSADRVQRFIAPFVNYPSGRR